VNISTNSWFQIFSLFFLITPPMKVEQTECSETSAYKIQTPENYPKDTIHLHTKSKAVC
jgi:hypothetical protein